MYADLAEKVLNLAKIVRNMQVGIIRFDPLSPHGSSGARSAPRRSGAGGGAVLERTRPGEGRVPDAAGALRLGGQGQGVRVSKIGKILQNFANFWRARSRLYQNEILQQNMRLTASFKLYKICILLHRCNPKILQKIGLKNQQFS